MKRLADASQAAGEDENARSLSEYSELKYFWGRSLRQSRYSGIVHALKPDRDELGAFLCLGILAISITRTGS